MGLTKGQHCSDWFILRRFGLTATLASSAFLHDDTIQESFQLIQILNIMSPADRIFQLSNSWFSQLKSNDEMIRGSVNADAVAVMNSLSAF